MKHVSKLIGPVMGRIAITDSPATNQDEPQESLQIAKPAKPPRLNPLRTPWQRKWLDLEVTHPDVQRLADAVEIFAGQWFRHETRKRWRVVVGRVGTGKSHCSRALRRFCQVVAYNAWCQHWRQLSSRNSIPGVLMVEWLAVASPEKCSSEDFDRFISDVELASIVIIDDIGTETDQFRTGVPVQRLCHLLNRIENKYAWLTTNKEPGVWQSTWDERVEDRLLSGELVEVMAPSYRSEQPDHFNHDRTYTVQPVKRQEAMA